MLNFIVKVRAAVIPACLLCLLAAPQGNAQVYKTVDAQGNVVFTDRKPQDTPAEIVDLKPTNAVSTMRSKESASAGAEPAAVVHYTQFSMVSPGNNQTMDYGVSAVDVMLDLEPALQEGHKVQFILDGKPYGSAGTSLSITLLNLSRGTHSIKARLLGEHGGALRSTSIVRFTIQQYSDQQSYQSDDGYYGYPYGARSARGARSSRGANEPNGVSGDIGAGGAIGADSPEYIESPPPRPTPHKFRSR